MNHQNMYIISLALTAFANLATTDMCRDLCPELDRLIRTNPNSYIKKKAILCARRAIRAVPDLLDALLSPVCALIPDTFSPTVGSSTPQNQHSLGVGIVQFLLHCPGGSVDQVHLRLF